MISKQKHKRFDIEAYYRNNTKTLWFGPLIFGTKAERFSLFQNYLAIFLKFKNETRMKPSYFIIGSKCFHTPRLQSKQKGTFVNNFQIFLPVWNVFVCSKLLRNQNRTKAFGPKFSRTDWKRFVSIQNFVSKTIIFDLFWNKSSKTKASDLERTLVWHC